MKKKLFLLTALPLMMGSLVGCGGSSDTIKVGILQYAPADALDIARAGFKDALLNSPLIKGVKNIEFIERFSMAKDVDDVNYAKSLVTNCDLMLGIATPSAIHLKNERDEAGKTTPLLFTAVTDPVDAHLVSQFPHQGSNVTGTSDDNPVESQIQLIKKCVVGKEASEIKFGIFYTSSESNSAVQARRAKTTAISEGLAEANIFDEPCTSITDLSAKCTSLANKVDVMYIPTDNLCASNMNIIKPILESSHTLCIVGEEGMLNGGHITYSVSYDYLGRRCGDMAAQILSGSKKIEEIDAEKSLNPDDWNKVYSSANIAAANLGYTIPENVLADFTDIDKK